MAAFDKVKSGIPQMDEILDYIRMGDNVVWQVTDLDEFRFFAIPYVKQAIEDHRDIVYIRFAQHEPILTEPEILEKVQVVKFDPDAGFESFTVAIHDEITRHGRDAFYVFDCLSELQSVWYTDLMMGNFFRVTCPYLFELDTVAYFPVMRGRHSFDAIARIRETTQLLLDVCSNEKWVYMHPIKVWERASDTMFLIPAPGRRGEHQPLLSDAAAGQGQEPGPKYRQLRPLFHHGKGGIRIGAFHTSDGDADYRQHNDQGCSFKRSGKAVF